jgi:hypothetical protein
MGCDVHITRVDDWTESETAPIQLEEWIAYVRSDPEKRLDGHADASLGSGESWGMRTKGLAVWAAYSGHGRSGNMAWFDHRRGQIIVKNPAEEILET